MVGPSPICSFSTGNEGSSVAHLGNWANASGDDWEASASSWGQARVFAKIGSIPAVLFSMTPVWSSALIALSAVTSLVSVPIDGPQDFHQSVPAPSVRMNGLASRLANLSPGQCRKQLSQAGELSKSFRRAGATNGVATPMRIVAPLGGVTFRVPGKRTKYGVLDCRQALLWIHLQPVLREHGVAKIRIDNFYRNRARIRRRGKKSQHAYGLAADIVSITLDDGRELVVEEDFFGKRGEPVCGSKAGIHPPKNATFVEIDGAIRMRNLVCALARRGDFHHMLTPNYNRAHENHFHFDLKRNNKWFSIN